MFQLGSEVLFSDLNYLKKLKGKRVALLAHPASLTQKFKPTWELLHEASNLTWTAAFGPQHGMRGEKQDNMIESDDYRDIQYDVPVFSLYGKVRRPTTEMLETFDVLLFDLQDVGCRIYTFLTTLFYVMEDCERLGKEVWVLDRPNPAGRSVEGFTLTSGYESFVGHAPTPMRHGLTLGEAALWYKAKKDLNHLKLEVVQMDGYEPQINPWPQELSWVNPSPNLPTFTGTQVYPGSVMVEGTHLSEGRGTTRPLELVGASDFEFHKVIHWLEEHCESWIQGAFLRPCYFEPTFHKYKGELCEGIQVHVDGSGVRKEEVFHPYRLFCGIFKAIKELFPNYQLWKEPPYEYEEKLLPIDILSGSSFLREWVNQEKLSVDELEQKLVVDEELWLKERENFLLY